MRGNLAGVGLGVAGGALVALAATGIADDGAANGARASHSELERVTVEPVPSERAQRGATPRGQKLTYFQVPAPLEVPPRTEVAVELSKCPRGAKAVTGYFHPERPGTLLNRSRPVLSTSRMWAMGAYNSTDAADRVTFGLVCLSRVK